jgi:hypothetical protein
MLSDFVVTPKNMRVNLKMQDINILTVNAMGKLSRSILNIYLKRIAIVRYGWPAIRTI